MPKAKKEKRYKVGDVVLAKVHKGIYEAKILTVRGEWGRKGVPTYYYVHYLGWKTKWDEWITADKMMDDSPESRELKLKVAKEKQRQKDVKNAGKPPIDEEVAKILQDPKEVQEDCLVKNVLGEDMTKYLVDDWERITQEKKLIELPRKVTVSTIIKRFAKTALKKNSKNNEDVETIINGMHKLFDRCLGTCLLYPFERLQYDSLLEKNKKRKMSDIYGAEHFIRLFVKLPALYADLEVERSQLALLHQKLSEMTKFIQKNEKEFFQRAYVKPSSEYVAAFETLSSLKE